MQRITVAEAERDFSKLVDRVHSEGISVELQRGDRVIARITPVGPSRPLMIPDLNRFLSSLPRLEGDSQAFSDDVASIRRDFPAEANSWD